MSTDKFTFGIENGMDAGGVVMDHAWAGARGFGKNATSSIAARRIKTLPGRANEEWAEPLALNPRLIQAADAAPHGEDTI